MKQMAVYAYSFQTRITEALSKANAMMAEARLMNYDIGMAISHFALGDIYTNAGMLSESTEEYEKAIDILSENPDTEKLQERVFIQLIPNLIKLKQLDSAETYLEDMEKIYKDKHENPFLLYIYQAYYYLNIEDVDQARKYIDDAEQANNAAPSHFYTTKLKHMQAEYARETENYEEAIQLYTELIQNNNNINVYNNYLQLKKTIANIYKKLGQNKEACETYHTIKVTRDSINAHNYSSQINLLRTIYQVDRLEVGNQEQRNRILFYSIVGGILILAVFVIFVIRIKHENNRLAASKQKLDKAQKNAENSIRTKSLFLSNMSHEIRTPLNALSGSPAILINGNIDADIRKQCNDIIQQNSDLLLKLIDDVVDLPSLERGKMQFHFSTYDAVALGRNVIDTVEKIKQTAASVVFQTSLESLELYTDEARLQQLLINLLINATKFTSEGSITLSFEVKDGVARFAVTDTGCGIAPEKQGRIFNRFEKLDENTQGSGLGLSICQLIVERFGGKIWIDSEYTGGSRFVFTHPITHTDTKKEEAAV
ncbi:MAG: ATP-binding protein [Bacteroides sp.]|nr:ATP-binding protein [Bacteroides sp.]